MVLYKKKTVKKLKRKGKYFYLIMRKSNQFRITSQRKKKLKLNKENFHFGNITRARTRAHMLTYTRAHAHAHTRAHICSHTHTHTCTRERTHARAHMLTHTHMHTRTHIRARTYAHTHARARAHAYMHLTHTDTDGSPWTHKIWETSES